MNVFVCANDMNIRRFEHLLETAVDETERQTIQSLLAEEKAKAELQAAETGKK
jgi:hypothetical protein